MDYHGRKVGNGIADNQEILAGGLKHDGRAHGPIRCFRPGCAGRVKHVHGPVWPIRCFTLVGADISSDGSGNSRARGWSLSWSLPPVHSIISARLSVMAGPDRSSVALLSSWPPRSSSWPAPTGHLFRQAIIFAHFCWLSGHFLPSSRHFWPFLLAQRSFSSVKPPFSAIFVGSAVIFFRQAIIFAHFGWLGGHFLPSGRYYRPFLSVWWQMADQVGHDAGGCWSVYGVCKPKKGPTGHRRPRRRGLRRPSGRRWRPGGRRFRPRPWR